MRVPPEWHPGHPDYPLHLVRVHLRMAALSAGAVLELIDAPDPQAVVARALRELAKEHETTPAAVVPLRPVEP